MKKQIPSARGGRPGITVADVAKACEVLRAQGRTIGPTNVRLELGTGSYNTIIRALRALGYSGKDTPKSGKSI
jgi:Plasmid replication region DNA-binding N-term